MFQEGRKAYMMMMMMMIIDIICPWLWPSFSYLSITLQVFESLCVRDEEMVCVELVATHKVLHYSYRSL